MNNTEWEGVASDINGVYMFDRCTVGPATVIVWTGSPAKDLDDGAEVCEAYIPLRSKSHPDGLMLVGRRRLGKISRQAACAAAIAAVEEALKDRGL